MTTPTQAQIEAAAEKIWEDFSARLGGEWKHLRDNAVIKVQCMATAKAALTAAAQVATVKLWPECEVVAAQVGEPNQKHLASYIRTIGRSIEDRTIERCAQVADNEEEAPGDMPVDFYNVPLDDAIRAAIRATKKSIAAAIRKLKDEP